MKSKYIKGTDKQYSIREDGMIIKHYKFKGIKSKRHKSFNNEILEYKSSKRGKYKYITALKFNGKNITFHKNPLLFKYFGYIICPKCYKKIELKLYRKVCNECMKKTRRKCSYDWVKNNRSRMNELQKKHYNKYKEKYAIAAREKAKTLHKNYIANKLHLPIDKVTNDILSLKRYQILLHRAIKQQKNEQ